MCPLAFPPHSAPSWLRELRSRSRPWRAAVGPVAAWCWIAIMLVAGMGGISVAEEPQPGKQVEQRFRTRDGGEVAYLLYLPENPQEGATVPLMLFLHGRGESSPPLRTVEKWGPPAQLAAGRSLPFIVVSPQCPEGDDWSSDVQQQRLLELLAHLSETQPVDRTRVCVTGLSMGGGGCWRLIAEHPTLFSAAAPVCGRCQPEWGPQLVALPIWIWHGTEDEIIPLSFSERMVASIREAGGTKIRYTSLEHVGHNSWSAAYETPELYAWMLEQKQPAPAQPSSAQPSSAQPAPAGSSGG